MRDHLSRHDRPLAFLFGAGTSCAVRRCTPDAPDTPLIPDVRTLTSECRDAVKELGCEYDDAWSAIADRCARKAHDQNVEHILSMLHMMLNAIGPSESLAGLDDKKLKAMDNCIRECIARVVSPPLKDIPSSNTPHHWLARWLAKTVRQLPVEVFTVNYDILFELAFEAERLPFFDGFIGSHEPFFHSDSLLHSRWQPAAGWTRLWKIHGSVNWRRCKSDGRIVRTRPQRSGEMIFPTFEKYDKSRQQPYAAYINQLERFLKQDNALLVVAGFGFGDEHLNEVIIRGLENNPRAHVYALLYTESQHSSSRMLEYAKQRGNVIIAGPKTGIIGRKTGVWTSKDAVCCKMPLGDFSVLCWFLDQMTSE